MAQVIGMRLVACGSGYKYEARGSGYRDEARGSRLVARGSKYRGLLWFIGK